jgi:glycosyltransferase involved in cell wall biosynthesis
VPYLFPKAGPLRKRAIYQMAQNSTGVIVTNRQDEAELHKAGSMPPIARIPIGSNIAVNPPADYDRKAWRSRKGIAPNALLIGFFGFINRSKGVDTLAHAVRILTETYKRDVHLLFIGGQTGRSDESNVQQADIAQELIGGLGITKRVHWTGFVDAELVSANLMACDVVALPFKDGVSLRRGTLMATLAHGCPIVTTFPAQIDPDLVDGFAMRMIPPDDPERLAEVLNELAIDYDQRAQLGQNARVLADQFTWDTIAALTVQFFETVKT